jgi:hypothetical protein
MGFIHSGTWPLATDDSALGYRVQGRFIPKAITAKQFPPTSERTVKQIVWTSGCVAVGLSKFNLLFTLAGAASCPLRIVFGIVFAGSFSSLVC